MAPDTTTTSRAATDGCVGLAEPARILARLTPDELYPARLAGPHAWHPWGLTAAPPTDRHLRLILPDASRFDAADQLTDRLQIRLTKTPWPPTGPLEIRRDGHRLDCRDHKARRSLIEVIVAADRGTHDESQVVTRDGWPILGELAAFTDRIRSVDVEQPSLTDLADLVSWVEHKMAAPTGHHPLDTPLGQLLVDQTRRDPHAADRLGALLTSATARPAHEQHGTLTYLHEQLDTARDQAASSRMQLRR